MWRASLYDPVYQTKSSLVSEDPAGMYPDRQDRYEEGPEALQSIFIDERNNDETASPR